MSKQGNEMFRLQGQTVKYHKIWVISISQTLTKLEQFLGYVSYPKKIEQSSVYNTNEAKNEQHSGQLGAVRIFLLFHMWCCSDRKRRISAHGAFLWGFHLISSAWTDKSSFWTCKAKDEMPGCTPSFSHRCPITHLTCPASQPHSK